MTRRARSPGRCMRKAGPDPRTLDAGTSPTRSTRLLLDLEDDPLRERSEYNESALAEAERAGDIESIDRLLLEAPPDQ